VEETLVFLHSFGARVLIVFAIVLGVWGAYHYFRDRQVGGSFRSTYLIMAALTPLESLLGVTALLGGGNPREGILHMVYGVFATLFVPGAYVYARGGDKRREALVLAGASWIVAIAFFRGTATG
jgi:hypothetical protein